MSDTPTKVGILQPGYLPWLGFFAQIATSDIFVIYDDVQFDKHGWRNRNRIKTANGAAWLTVPVLHKGRGPQLINAVKINRNENWKTKHKKTIEQNYSKAKYFEKYWGIIRASIDEDFELLIDLNMSIIRKLLDFLGISTELHLSSELSIYGDRVTRLIKIIKRFNGTHFIEGPSGISYLDNHSDEFDKLGITIHYYDYAHPQYSQLYGKFVSHLSIIDLLFNHGDDSLNILRS